ncbi:deoxyribose-phosphate aldolase [Mycobacteroides abscessus subsp. abscessus]|nr:deoxyribose-phosphate aldolase [Mycobacteroides abscessus subsp. abscessus]
MPYSAEDELRTGKILRVSATAPRFRSATMSSGSGPAWAMSSPVGDRLQVKASGGIRTARDAAAMLEAGATRLGLSGSRIVLDGFAD